MYFYMTSSGTARRAPTIYVSSSSLHGSPVNDSQDNNKALGLTELLDKELQVSMLEAALAGDRLGGTLLFFGPDGSGKSSLAFWLAAALNCTTNLGKKGPCGSCSSCRKVENLIHPDLHWVFPVPGSLSKSSGTGEDQLVEAFAKKRSSPWLDLQFTAKCEHHLAAVHSIREEAGKSRFEGRCKVFVITGADRLRTEAANSLLKLLEEPLPEVVLILCSDRPAGLLPTILSRCQRLRVNRPRTSTLEAVLRERFGVDPALARELVAASDGTLTLALRMKDRETFDVQKMWVDKSLTAALEDAVAPCYQLVEDRSGPMWNRGDFERYLAFLAQAVRDILIYRLQAESPTEADSGVAMAIFRVRDYSRRVGDIDSLISLLGRLISLQDQLNRNVNLRLLGWSILQNLREVVTHGRRDR